MRQEVSTGTEQVLVAGCLSVGDLQLYGLDAHARLNPPGMFLVCIMKGCLSPRILTQRCFRLQSGWPPPHQYCSQAFSVLFCFVILDKHTHTQRVIHFSGKTGYSKILPVTTQQTCSYTLIFIKEPQQYAWQTPLWCGPSPNHPPCLPCVLGELAVSLDLSFLGSQAVLLPNGHTECVAGNSYGLRVIGTLVNLIILVLGIKDSFTFTY